LDIENMARINIITPVKFECQKGCSNCCKSGGVVHISEEDVTNISKYIKISRDEFWKKYTTIEGKKIYLKEQEIDDCIFLKDDKCTIYPVRPTQCRTFPFWPQNVKSEKRWKMVMDECPGISEGEEFTKQDIEASFNGKAITSEK